MGVRDSACSMNAGPTLLSARCRILPSRNERDQRVEGLEERHIGRDVAEMDDVEHVASELAQVDLGALAQLLGAG
jgi:hypothetical protein